MHIFLKYKCLVDKEMDKICGHSSQMISDFCYFDYFEDGFSPRETALAALIDNIGFNRLYQLAFHNQVDCSVEELLVCR